MKKSIDNKRVTSKRKGRADMKVGEVKKQHHAIKSKEDRYVDEHHEGSYGVKKKDFMAILAKASQPIKDDEESDSENAET